MEHAWWIEGANEGERAVLKFRVRLTFTAAMSIILVVGMDSPHLFLSSARTASNTPLRDPHWSKTVHLWVRKSINLPEHARHCSTPTYRQTPLMHV